MLGWFQDLVKTSISLAGAAASKVIAGPLTDELETKQRICLSSSLLSFGMDPKAGIGDAVGCNWQY